MISYNNPIIPGFYPDPSICRVGEDYYLVTSSFEFSPGVPLFHSRDLIHWEQLGYVLTHKTQLPLEGSHTSGGIFAPTIRFHEGRFYMITTNVSNGGNFYVWTDDIHGEWSDPVWVAQSGIDPSIFFDEDGTVYFASTFSDEGGKGIGQCTIDIKSGEMLTKTKMIWHGTGGKYPEGPHLYKRNRMYYLMISEGGTEYGHMETIARSLFPWGPFESCPRNPILTHRDTDLAKVPFQALGHADFVETPDGDSWIVFHGIRTTQFMMHHLGRETMIAPLVWDNDGWPVINGGNLISPEMHVQHMLEPFLFSHSPVRDNFDEDTPAKTWSYLRNPKIDNYVFTQRPGFLGLTAGADTLDDCGSPTFLGRRQQHFNVRTQTLVEFLPNGDSDQAGITVFHTNEHHYDLFVTRRSGRRVAVLRKRVGDMQTESNAVSLPEHGNVLLRVEATKTDYFFFAGTDEKTLKPVGQGRTQLLSSECTICTFTGCFIGLFTQGSSTAWFDFFDYEPQG